MYKKTVLANGLTVVTESIPYYSTISLGMWWKTGGRFENEDSNGISHFIEHMLFKGTRKRSAYDIAREIDAVGGAMNAFTGKEYTCLYARVLRKDTDLALDILADMYQNSLFQDDDLEREKYVIAQEIKMVEDNPEEYIYEMFNASYFKGHPLGLPILGKQENIEKFTREELVNYFEEHYTPRNIVITATGRIDHETFVKKVMQFVDGLGAGGSAGQAMEIPSPNTGIDVYEKDLEHVYLCIGTHGVSQVDKKRYCLYLLNAIMGGSMSSHLFQEIREKRGLVYNIYSYVNCYFDAGTFGISTSTSVEFVDEVLTLIKREVSRIRDEGITDAELAFSKEHLKGNLFISLEGSETRMGRLAKNEIYFGDYIPLKDTLREIDRIAKVEVDEIGKAIFSNPEGISLTILGGVDKGHIEELWKG
ncbi:MAG: Protease 3 precursor [Syntrophorhabdus sp. PtaU1.Bin153]|nr:MAG: Protease 3 precursor [Syntrophorhabdus sp. PtaU1.Bin153]